MTSVPIYTIAFKDNEFKRNRMTCQLRALGLDTKFIDAVDGRKLSSSEMRGLTSSKRGFWMKHGFRLGSMGCALSHFQAWQTLVESGSNCALILEDDAQLDCAISNILPCLAAQSKNFDIVNLHHASRRPRQRVHNISKTHHLSVVKYNGIETLAYVISKEAASRLLEIARPPLFEVDVFMNRWWDHGVTSLVVEPALAVTVDEPSSIGYDTPPPPLFKDSLLLKLIRKWHRLQDSVYKRLGFRRYVEQVRCRITDTLI